MIRGNRDFHVDSENDARRFTSEQTKRSKVLDETIRRTICKIQFAVSRPASCEIADRLRTYTGAYGSFNRIFGYAIATDAFSRPMLLLYMYIFGDAQTSPRSGEFRRFAGTPSSQRVLIVETSRDTFSAGGAGGRVGGRRESGRRRRGGRANRVLAQIVFALICGLA